MVVSPDENPAVPALSRLGQAERGERALVRPDAEALYQDLRAISFESAAHLEGRELLTDDDLYDEDGIPA